MTPPSVSEEMIRAALEPFAKFRTAEMPGKYSDRIDEYFTPEHFAEVRRVLAHLPAGSEAVKPDVMKGYLLAWSAAYAAKDGGNDAVLNAVHATAAPPSTPPAASVQEGEDRKAADAELVDDVQRYLMAETTCMAEKVSVLGDMVRTRLSLLRSKQAPTVAVPDGTVGEMTESRAIYFLERFKRDEKMLGPHEQWALDFAVEALRARAEQRETPSAVVGEDTPHDYVRNQYRPRRCMICDRFDSAPIHAVTVAAAPTSDGR